MLNHTIGKYEITKFVTDYTNRVSINNLVDIVQDIGETDSAKYNLQNSELLKKGLTWIIIGQTIKIDKDIPVDANTLIVETWNSGSKGIKFFRDNLFYKNEISPENIFGRSTSEWVVVDAKSHMPKKPSEAIDITKFKEMADTKRAIDEKIPVIKSFFKSVENHIYEYTVQISDLDRNIHLHNVHYIKLCMDALANLESLNPKKEIIKLKEISILYKREVFFKDTVEVYIKNEDDYILLEGVIKESKETSFLAKIKYNKTPIENSSN